MNITTGDEFSDIKTIGLGCGPDREFSNVAAELVSELGDDLQHSLDDQEFEGKVGEVAKFRAHGPGGGREIVVVGLGDEPGADTVRVAAGDLGRACMKSTDVATDLAMFGPTGAVVEGFTMAQYRFEVYKSEPKPALTETLMMLGADEEAIGRAQILAAATLAARDLINTPPIDQSPSDLAGLAEEIGVETGLRIVVRDEADLAEGNFGGLLGVAAGSARPPRLVEMWHEPQGATSFVALVGKGITFDSGGLSLKPASSMETMKTDMSGAAVVISVLEAVAKLDLPIKVVGIAALTDNMPGGLATKPGDVLRTRNGKTIEVLNTDAEGRLVLADGLALATEFEPDFIVDIATLTGGAVVALGEKIAAVIGDDDLAAEVIEVGRSTGERFWQLPLPKEYRKLIDSPIADMKNTAGRWASALTAALLLAEFVGEVPWIHLDIAGPASWPDDEGYQTKGGSGFATRTLIELLAARALKP